MLSKGVEWDDEVVERMIQEHEDASLCLCQVELDDGLLLGEHIQPVWLGLVGGDVVQCRLVGYDEDMGKAVLLVAESYLIVVDCSVSSDLCGVSLCSLYDIMDDE
jgi:hypothetical protein